MIKEIFIIISCMLTYASVSYACDGCGATTNGSGIGLLTNYRSNYLRVGYFRSHFSPTTEHAQYSSSDVFSQVNFSLRYALKKYPKLRIVAFVPYGNNKRTTNGSDIIVDGFSDAKLLVNYTLVNGTIKNEALSYYVEVGGGLSFPTGKYDSEIEDSKVPDNFNTGIGSLGYLLQCSGILSYNKYGFALNANYQYNQTTKEAYRFGDQLSCRLSAFKEFNIKAVDLIPNGGLLCERIASNTYSNGNAVPETDGKGLFLFAGINIKINNWVLGTSWSFPLTQNYASGTVNAETKLATHLTFLF